MSFKTVSNGKGEKYNPNDVILTPVNIAKKIISWLPLKPFETVLDPFYGTGNFYDNFPPDVIKDYTEIMFGKDFFKYEKHVDWIISNPPYSKYTEVMNHSYKIADNIVYLIPLNKVVSSWGRVKDLQRFGGIYKMWIMPAGKCGFPFGFPACACWFKKGYKGPVNYEIEDLK